MGDGKCENGGLEIGTRVQAARSYLGSLGIAAGDTLKSTGAKISEATDQAVTGVLDATPESVLLPAFVAGSALYGAGLFIREGVRMIMHDAESVIRGGVRGR